MTVLYNGIFGGDYMVFGLGFLDKVFNGVYDGVGGRSFLSALGD